VKNRNPMPPRKKRLGRTAGLPRTGGLPRGTGPSRATELSRTTWKRKPGKATDPTPAMKAAVRKRDLFACARCGMNIAERPSNVHHRVRRSQGGKHVMENLVTLCGDGVAGCHGWVHANITEARAFGWLLLGTDDPALEGVMYAGECGSWARLWLTSDGRRLLDDPGEVAA
jgi:hypothetical protein